MDSWHSILQPIWVDGLSLLHHHLLQKGMTQCHGYLAVDLPFHQKRVDGKPAIVGGYRPRQTSLPCLRVNLHLGNLHIK